MKDMMLRHPDGREVPVPGWMVKDKVGEGYQVLGPIDEPAPDERAAVIQEVTTELLPAYLEARTRDELREIAQEHGVDVPGNASKAAFIEAILEKASAAIAVKPAEQSAE